MDVRGKGLLPDRLIPKRPHRGFIAVIQVAVKAKDAKDLPKLVDGLKKPFGQHGFGVRLESFELSFGLV